MHFHPAMESRGEMFNSETVHSFHPRWNNNFLPKSITSEKSIMLWSYIYIYIYAEYTLPCACVCVCVFPEMEEHGRIWTVRCALKKNFGYRHSGRPSVLPFSVAVVKPSILDIGIEFVMCQLSVTSCRDRPKEKHATFDILVC